MTSLASLLTESDVPPLREHQLPMGHLLYGIIPMVLFLVLLAFLWMFRNTAAKVGMHDPHLRSEADTAAGARRDGH